METVTTENKVAKEKNEIETFALGCAKPYPLTYSGGIRTQNQDDQNILETYVRAHNNACRALLALLEPHMRNPEYELIFALMLVPKNVPEKVVNDPSYLAIMDENNLFGDPGRSPDRREATPNTWEMVNKKAGYHLLQVLLDPKDPGCATSRPSRIFHHLLNQYPIPVPPITEDQMAAVFDPIPFKDDRNDITNAVFAVLCSFYSSRSAAIQKNKDRFATREAYLQKDPGFFKPFDSYCQDQRAWMHGCAVFTEARKTLKQQLKDEKADINTPIPSILSACQRTAMTLEAASHIAPWKNLRALTDEDKRIADLYPKIVATFEKAIPAELEITQEDDIFRRFCNAADKPLDLTRDVFHIKKVLSLYNDTHKVLTSEAEINEFILQTTQMQHGKHATHLGWEKICRNVNHPKIKGIKQLKHQSHENLKKIYDFVVNDVSAFMQASREVQIPEADMQPDFWPALAEKERWRIIKEGPGNQATVELTIPNYAKVTDTDPSKRIITIILRGHTPFNYSKKMDNPITVKYMPKFIPDHVEHFKTDNNHQEKSTYRKLQAMKLIIRDGKVRANISAMQITQVSRDPMVTKAHASNIKANERVAIMHFLPGGSILCSIAIFEKHGGAHGYGWKPVVMQEIINDTREESYKKRKNGSTIHINNRRMIKRTFLTIDDISYARIIGMTEEEKSKQTAGKSTLENETTLQKFGQIKTEFGKTYYKQIAARIANICNQNNVGYLIVAGGGRLAVNRKIPHPVKKFFSMSRAGGMTALSGYLDIAMKKAGVTTLTSRAVAANFWVKDVVYSNDYSTCKIIEKQKPIKRLIGNIFFTGDDILDPAAFSKLLKSKEVSGMFKILWDSIPKADRALLEDKAASELKIQGIISEGLNSLINGRMIFEEKLFNTDSFSPELNWWLTTNSTVKINRLLLDNAFEKHVKPCKKVSQNIKLISADGSGEHAVAYALNATWAILLDHQVPEFREYVDKQKLKTEQLKLAAQSTTAEPLKIAS